MVSAGSLLLLTGTAAERVGGLFVIVVGVGLGLLSPVVARKRDRSSRQPTNGSVRLPDGTQTMALRIPLDLASERAAVLFMALICIAALILVIDPVAAASFAVIAQPLFGLIALLVGTRAIAGIRAWSDQPMVALAPPGLLVRGLGTQAFAPWDAIRGVASRLDPKGRPTAMYLSVDSSAVRRSGVQILGGTFPAVPYAELPIAAEQFLELVNHYRASPLDRTRLGSVESIPLALVVEPASAGSRRSETSAQPLVPWDAPESDEPTWRITEVPRTRR